jgi:hypothetical protein
MQIQYFAPMQVTRLFISIGFSLLLVSGMMAQANSVVLVHADKSSGYGVAWGGPKNSPDMIVTALHLVAGKKNIQVAWQGKTSVATVIKIYKPSDLALLKLRTPLGIPLLGLYSGEAPVETDVNFWEIPVATTTPTKKTTSLDGKTSLASISPQIANEPAGLTKALCFDGTESYPGMKTSVINFKEANIRKAHSGSPLTYNDKILGMVDGGAKLVDGRPLIWAIPAADFNKLYSMGTPPASDMITCTSPGTDSKYLYSGIRADNPFLTEAEIDQAILLNTPLNIESSTGTKLELHHNYTMTFGEVYQTLYEEEQQALQKQFKPGESVTLNDLLNVTVHFYSEDATGVSIMIPDQCTLTNSTDAYGTMNTTTSPGGLITMSIYISAGTTTQDAVTAMNSFQQFIRPDDQSITPITVDSVLHNGNYYSLKYEHKNKLSGAVKSIVYANMTIDGTNFLAVSVNVADWQPIAKDPKEKMYFYLMEVCSNLSNFPFY